MNRYALLGSALSLTVLAACGSGDSGNTYEDPVAQEAEQEPFCSITLPPSGLPLLFNFLEGDVTVAQKTYAAQVESYESSGKVVRSEFFARATDTNELLQEALIYMCNDDLRLALLYSDDSVCINESMNSKVQLKEGQTPPVICTPEQTTEGLTLYNQALQQLEDALANPTTL